ncbi:MAG: ribonuclease III [Deltaproteobacteria bacterium]|nr:ribonuclease III [Deltaproteobacteria bacterium]MBW1953133.1 ribonuclease III [Deltaproteobacteria bacterium]MBW1987011.1 ribonuclease III [Deltaproteobacteria bacterium]MBW2134032.1 ribonuclease III [Deltaproteobacteria bacterium]
MTQINSVTPGHELSPDRRQALLSLANRVGYVFQDLHRLDQALTHSSYAYEYPGVGTSNERLEFLGDAVLALVISDLLMEQFPQASEGDLSRWRAYLVNAKQLAVIAQKLELGNCLLLGRGEEQQAGRKKPSVLGNALEAVLAAIYLDGGLKAARQVIARLFADRLVWPGQQNLLQDFRTRLQEYTQKYFKLVPNYQVVSEAGPAHAKNFEVEVRLDNRFLARGQGRTKKQAAQAAARQALECLIRNKG